MSDRNYTQVFSFSIDGDFAGAQLPNRPQWVDVGGVTFTDEDGGGYEYGTRWHVPPFHTMDVSYSEHAVSIIIDDDEEERVTFPKSALPGLRRLLDAIPGEASDDR